MQLKDYDSNFKILLINNFYFIKLFIILFFFITIFEKVNANEIEIINNTPGTGPEIKYHYKISVHYRGFLENGTEFDSSFKRNQPFIFQIGTQQVIPGWEIALMGMKVGGKRKIKIPAELAYGKKGAGNLIPPNAALIFEIEIIEIQPPSYKLISSESLNKLQKQKIILIDIRSKSEWKKTGIIKNSKKITAFDKKGNFKSDFLQSVQKIANTTSKIIFISKKGDISAILANGFVEKLGYNDVSSLKGGMEDWIEKELPLK